MTNNVKIYDSAKKAITSIPGWANLFADTGGKDNPIKAALTYQDSTWAFACIKKRSNALSSIKWEIRQETPDGFEVTDGNGIETLLNEVNPEMNWIDLIRATESDLLIYGKAYWLKITGNNSQAVVGLRRLNPINVEVKTSAEGISGFVQKLDGKAKEPFEREDVVYFHEYDPQDDLGGVSATQVALDAINALTNTKRYIAAFFKNNAEPNLLITPKETLQPSDVIKAQNLWNKLTRGVNKQHKTIILSQQFDVHKINTTLKDLALKEVEESARRDIAAAYEIPPTIVGAWDSANYATAKEERLAFYTDTIIPRADYIASVINAELVNADFGSEIEFIWLYKDLPVFEVDINTETERVVKLVEMGIITPEVAAQELGYEVDDVPQGIEDVPVLEVEPPVDPEPPVEPVKAIIEVEPDDEDFFMQDLKKFYIKSKKRLTNGKSAICEFNSEYIPTQLMEAIKAQIEDVETTDELADIFDDIRENKQIWGNYP